MKCPYRGEQVAANMQNFSTRIHCRRYLLLMTCFLTLLVNLYAVPAYRGWQVKMQPDGTPVSLRQIGDEFYHYWETEDGRLAVEQEDGTFVVTNEQRPGETEFSARRHASLLHPDHIRQYANHSPAKAPMAIGARNFAPKGLVILVQFPDVQFDAENDSAAFHNMLNKRGYTYGGATGSAVDYFSDQSNGTYKPSFDVVGPVTLPHNLAYYGAEGTISGTKVNDRYIADFVIDAILAADSVGCDFSQYDSDNDDIVDIVYFFIAGKGQAAGGSPETIWPHNANLFGILHWGYTHGTNGYYIEADENGTITDFNLPVLDGKYVNTYACSAELKMSGTRSGIGTLCHEFSHVLGLPDYYDTQYGDNYANSMTPGEWSIMDSGSYNNDEMTPPNYSIFDKYFLGWATPKFLAKNAVADITMTTDYDDAYQITGGSYRVAYSNTGTVYYIENRQNVGWDEYLPWHGMLVWRVRYSSTVWSNNEPNNTAGYPRYTLVSAGGGTMIGNVYDWNSESWVHYAAYDPYPGYLEVSSYTPYTGCSLTNISESDGNISFNFNQKTQCSYSLDGSNCSVPDNGVVASNGELSLIITPDDGYSLADAGCWEVFMGSNTLTYGTDFTYDAAANTFHISSVTDDIILYASAYPIVTWYANGAVHAANIAVNNKITLPEPPATCDSGREFVGWCSDDSYASATEAPEWARGEDDFTTDAYYAVYGEIGSEPVSKSVVFFDLASNNGWENGVAYTTVLDEPVLIEALGGGNNGKYYISDSTWRAYSGGTVRISVLGGAVTAVTPAFGKYSKATGSFTVTNGIATLAPTARTDFFSLSVNYLPYSYYSTTCAPSVHTYTVIFLDEDGTPLDEPQIVEEGSAAIAPDVDVPDCEQLTWDKDFDNVTEDMTVTAVWTTVPLASGTCGAEGDNLTWTLDCNGTLTVSGTGAMADFDPWSAPWEDYRSSTQLTSVIIEEGVTTVGEHAFYNCSFLSSVTVPNTVTAIKDYAFEGCSDLRSVTLPNSVTTIGYSAFAGCSFLESIDLGTGLTDLGSDAFAGCYALESIVIPESVTEMGLSIFDGCQNLTSVQLPNGLTSIGWGMFKNCVSLPSIVIPGSVTTIGIDAFSYCRDLTNVVLPPNLTEIGSSAFYYCENLSSITIPATVESIDYAAFAYCSAMKSVRFEGSEPPTVYNMISCFMNTTCSFYVPCATKDAYLEALNNDLSAANKIIASRVVEELRYRWSVTSSDEQQGVVAIVKEPTSCSDLVLTFRADANTGYAFKQWSDGNTTNPRSLTLEADLLLTAQFEASVVEPIEITGKTDISSLGVDASSELEVTGAGHLTIDAPTTIHSLTLEYTESGHAQLSGITNLTADEIEVAMHLPTPVGPLASQWFAIAVPFEVSVATGIRYEGSSSPASYGNDFVINEYDGYKRATTQRGWTRLTASATLYPGRMYMFATPAHTTWYFKAADPTALTEPNSVDVNAFTSTIGDNHSGWNGIANTLFTNASGGSAELSYATTYNNSLGIYETKMTGSYVFGAAVPFFVQMASDGTVNFTDKSASSAPLRKEHSRQSDGIVTLALTNHAGTYTDNAYWSVNADKPDGYQIGRDLQKMQTSSPYVPQLWIEAYGMQLAAFEAPFDAEACSIPLGIHAPQEGIYTLRAEDVPSDLSVILMRNGNLLWDITAAPYNFTLTQGSNQGYALYVQRVQQVVTGIHSAHEPTVAQKVMINGRICIIRDGKTYSITGVCVNQ